MQPRGSRQVVISFRLEHLLGWGITIILCLIPIVMWEHVHPPSTIIGFSAIMLNLGRITGLVGMVMYALNLIYSTRLRFLERWFGGLNRVYIAHHLLGGLALVLIALHPIFLSLRYVTTSLKQAALILIPNGLTPISDLFNRTSFYHPLLVEQWALFFGIIAFWGMVILLLVTFFIKLPYRVWLFTHKFLGVAFFIASLHVLFIQSDTSVFPMIKYYILAFSVLGLIAYIYRTLLGNILIRQYDYIIEEVKVVAGNVTQLKMRPVKDRMSYMPGQFIFISFKDSRTKLSREWHPFSISSGDKDGFLEVSVKGLGDYTNFLANISPGSSATLEGAYGRFSYRNYKNLNQVWVAGGIGITPFLSMAKSLPEDGYSIDLFYSVKTKSELIDWESLYGAAITKNGHFRVIPYVGDQYKERLGVDLIQKISGDLSKKDIFICGPPPMMSSLKKQLKAKGVPAARIHSEEFGMS